MANTKLQTQEKLNTLRIEFEEELRTFRASPDFNWKWHSYQRTLGALEAMELVMSVVEQ